MRARCAESIRPAGSRPRAEGPRRAANNSLDVAEIFQALADPSRRAIFESLTRGEAAVKDLTARFDISQPAIAQHLATLKDAGLVNGRREGRCVFYRVDPNGMKPLIDWIAHYRAFWTEHVDRLEQLLAKMDK